MSFAGRIRSFALVAALVACLPAGASAAGSGGAAVGTVVAGAGGAGTDQPLLQRGARGRAVRTLQALLTRAGLATPADGAFGPRTQHNVKAFQRRMRLRADGVVTARVLAALRRAAAARTAPASSPPAPEPVPAGAAPAAATGVATLLADGTAAPPAGAPPEVVAAITAGNRIASLPYRWGGGHRDWEDSGYDCSGSVGYALHGGGLLDATADSTGFMSYGEAGPGTWITIYANRDHVYMVVAGVRFDTSGARPSRWQAASRAADGFTVRHPAGF